MRGDAEAASRLNEWLTGYPEYRQPNDAVVDLSRRVEEALITALAGKDLLEGDRLRRQMKAMKAELVSPKSGMLEQILADGVTFSLFALQRATLLAAQPTSDPGVNQLRDRHLTMAQKRFHAAVRSWELFTRKKMEIDRRGSKGRKTVVYRHESGSRPPRRALQRKPSRIKA